MHIYYYSAGAYEVQLISSYTQLIAYTSVKGINSANWCRVRSFCIQFSKWYIMVMVVSS